MHFPSMFAVIEALISHPKRMSYVIGCEVISKVASKSFQSVTMTIGLFFFPQTASVQTLYHALVHSVKFHFMK